MLNIDEEISSEMKFIKGVMERMQETEELQELRGLYRDAWSALNNYYRLNCARLEGRHF